VTNNLQAFLLVDLPRYASQMELQTVAVEFNKSLAWWHLLCDEKSATRAMEIGELIIHIPFASCQSCSRRTVITTKLKGEREVGAQARADIYAVRNN
jgi:hypothetical protein